MIHKMHLLDIYYVPHQRLKIVLKKAVAFIADVDEERNRDSM